MGSECRTAEGQEETVWWLRAEEAVESAAAAVALGAELDAIPSCPTPSSAVSRRQGLSLSTTASRCHRDGGASPTPLDDASVRCVASTLTQENAPACLLFFAWLFSGLYGYIHLC